MLELPEAYYLDNFQTLIKFINERYSDLYNAEEIQFIELFNRLEEDSKRLYLRLISRVGPYIREDKLNYSEISNLTFALEQLISLDFIQVNQDWPIENILSVLIKPELIALNTDATIKLKSLKKDSIIHKLIETHSDEELTKKVYKLSRLIYPLKKEIIQTFCLLFFGNARQNLTDFILTDLGLTKFELYPISSKDRFFNTRKLIDNTLLYYQLRDFLDIALEERNNTNIEFVIKNIPSTLEERRLTNRKEKILNRVGKFYEQQKELNKALSIYEQSKRAPSKERQIRILDKQQEYQKALEIIKEIQKDPFNEEELEFALNFLPKLQKKLGMQINIIPKFECTVQEIIVENSNDRVEEITRNYYEQKENYIFYTENHLSSGLLALFFWDIIYANIRGAFFHPFQWGPVDLFTDDFYKCRKESIDIRLQEIRSGAISSVHIKKTYLEKFGISNYLIHWEILNKKILDLALSRIPFRALALIFERMIKDLKHNKSGFPDLICFPKNSKDYLWIEVKGPGDRLQKNQKRWLSFFTKNEIPFRVTHVSWKAN